jgi:hypothetical protein
VLNVFALEAHVLLLVTIVLLVVKIFAFVNSLMFSAESYVAAGKLTKPAWVLILGLGLALQVLLITASPINLIGLVFTIAALVYLADVRPALASLTRR